MEGVQNGAISFFIPLILVSLFRRLKRKDFYYMLYIDIVDLLMWYFWTVRFIFIHKVPLLRFFNYDFSIRKKKYKRSVLLKMRNRCEIKVAHDISLHMWTILFSISDFLLQLKVHCFTIWAAIRQFTCFKVMQICRHSFNLENHLQKTDKLWKKKHRHANLRT